MRRTAKTLETTAMIKRIRLTARPAFCHAPISFVPGLALPSYFFRMFRILKRLQVALSRRRSP